MTALPRPIELLDAGALYGDLIAGADPARDPFDAHLLSSAIAIAAAEAREAALPPEDRLGLARPELDGLLAAWFPGAAPICFGAALLDRPGDRPLPLEERCLRDLLASCSSTPGPSGAELGSQLAAIVARRAQQGRHLWQDLGLQSRGELSRLMARHFAPLAARNKGDMKWKKFFSRALCLDGSFPICTAPSCGECDDFEGCFGEEKGESVLAALRRR